MIRYKLTTQNMTTYYGRQKWILGKQETKPEIQKPTLCSNDVFHFYDNPELAVLLNLIHANIDKPLLFKVSCNEVVHDGVKGGSTKMKLVKELPLPVFTLNQRVYFSILCAKEIYHSKEWLLWADNWIANIDRSKAAADAAAYAAAAAAYVYTAAYAYAAAYATDRFRNKLKVIIKKVKAFKE